MPYSITQETPKRSITNAMWRGAKCKCPSCGEGNMFRAYLKVSDECTHCGEVLSHHRADDLPPYIAIVIVGHILIGAMLHLEMEWTISPMTYLMVLMPLGIIMPLAMLPSIKGSVVGLQWAQRMHGFGGDDT